MYGRPIDTHSENDQSHSATKMSTVPETRRTRDEEFDGRTEHMAVFKEFSGVRSPRMGRDISVHYCVARERIVVNIESPNGRKSFKLGLLAPLQIY
jgi:hypothetical protein